jgi:hypothetical protein
MVVSGNSFWASLALSESASSYNAALLAVNADQPGIARTPRAELITSCPWLCRGAGSTSQVSSAAASTF